MDKKNAIIIGAGPAGLTAAHELLTRARQNWNVIVLEESSIVGGISRTVLHNGNRLDMGGHRFFSKEQRILDWWNARLPIQGFPSFDDLVLGRELKLSENGPDPEKDDSVMLNRHRVSRIYFDNKFFDYPVSLNVKTLRAMGPVTALSVGTSYAKSSLRKLPENNLENFYVNRFGRKLYSMFFEGYTEKLWGRHPRIISADWGAQRVKGLSVTAVLRNAFLNAVGMNKDQEIETSLIEHFFYPKYGPGQMWEMVTSEVRDMGGEIKFGQKVTSIQVVENGEVQEVRCNNGSVYKADAVLSSMPLADLVPAMTDSTSKVRTIAANLPYRDFITVGLLVPKLALKNDTKKKTLANIIPDNWIYVQESSVKLGRIQVFNNWSPYMVADPLRTVWLGLEYFCNEGDQFWKLSDKERVNLAVDELITMGVLSTDIEVLDSHVEYVKKAYPAYFDSYDQINELIGWLNTHQNLICIGRNGQHRYNNMDHSMMTAFHAVNALISGSMDRTEIWNVNMEQEYHEKG